MDMRNRTLHENILNPRLLPTIWVTVLLSMLFRDVHEFLREGMITELANEGTVYGTRVTDTTLIVSAVALQLPIAMVLLSKVLPDRTNRIANRIVAALMVLGVLGFWPKDGDDYIFGAFQLAALALIGVICHRWVDTPNAATDRVGVGATS